MKPNRFRIRSYTQKIDSSCSRDYTLDKFFHLWSSTVPVPSSKAQNNSDVSQLAAN